MMFWVTSHLIPIRRNVGELCFQLLLPIVFMLGLCFASVTTFLMRLSSLSQFG